MPQPYLIGLTGGSASGKTGFLEKMEAEFGDTICLISQDNYYKPMEQQPVDENGEYNFDTPDSIDFPYFLSDLKKLLAGQTVQKQSYTFNNPNLTPETLTFRPQPIILVEGIFVLYYQELAEMLDLKLFIDAKEHFKITRRIRRDAAERGYDLEDVLYRYVNHVVPAYMKYIQPYKDNADLVIMNNTHFDTAYEVLAGFLRKKLTEHVQ